MSYVMPSLCDYLEENTEWSDLMGESTFPLQADQSVPGPYCVFRLDKEGRDYSMDGPAELYMADIEFKLLSDKYKQAHGVANLLSEVLDGFRGTMGDISVTHILFMDSRDGELKDEVLGLYPVICDISVWYTRA